MKLNLGLLEQLRRHSLSVSQYAGSYINGCHLFDFVIHDSCLRRSVAA